MKKIRFALVGCGRVGNYHIRAIKNSRGGELAAVCDLNKFELADAFGKKHGVPAYRDYYEMLAKEDIDIVNVLTPSGMHPEHAIDIMRNFKKHVIVEKPPALSLAEMQQLINASKETGCHVFPVFQNRYNKAVRKVYEDIRNGTLGRVALATVRVRWSRGQPYYDRDAWRGTWALDGGALTNQGIHYIDLLRHLVGDVTSVVARKSTQLVDVEVEDTFTGLVQFQGGGQGIVEVTTAARPTDFEASISVLSENGTAVISGTATNELLVYTPRPEAAADYFEPFPDQYGFGHDPLVQDAIECLTQGKPHPITLEDARETVRFLNGLYRAAEDKTEISFAGDVSSRLLGRPDEKLRDLYRRGVAR